MGKTVALNGQDGHRLRFIQCMLSRKPYMNEHTYTVGYGRDSQTKHMIYEGHFGIKGDYEKTLIGTDGNVFNTVGTYGVVGEAGFTLGGIRVTEGNNRNETTFDVSVFGGSKCGAEVNLTGKTGRDTYTRVCLTGNLHGKYEHSLPLGNDQYAFSQTPVTSIKAGANVGLQVDASVQRLKVDINAGPEYQYNTATIDGQQYTYQNGVIRANLGVEYTPPMPEGSGLGLVFRVNAGLQSPAYISKDDQGKFHITGVTNPANTTPVFGASVIGVF